MCANSIHRFISKCTLPFSESQGKKDEKKTHMLPTLNNIELFIKNMYMAVTHHSVYGVQNMHSYRMIGICLRYVVHY